jgi:DNA topoisomerase VI subunit B
VKDTFITRRTLDFFSEKELTKQIGHGPDLWPLVILKELTDNILDACEESEVAPNIVIGVSKNTIVITDNGPGIAAKTVTDILKWEYRVSSREAYVAPTRGAQGNALKTIIAMPFALDREKGEVVIESKAVKHTITVQLDHVRQEPTTDHIQGPGLVKTGTRITVKWPVCASSKLNQAKPQFLQMAENYGWLNPHLSMMVTWDGKRCVSFEASDPSWKKWRPNEPAPPHWYTEPSLTRLIRANIAHDLDNRRSPPRTVREFVSEFNGLSSTAKQKQVLEESDTAHISLPKFFGDGSDVSNRTDKLLAAMKRHSRPTKPLDLGLIGKEHLAACLKSAGVDLETFKYLRVFGEREGLPEIIEAAFGYCPNSIDKRRIITGVNWSVTIGNPFRSLNGQGLDAILADQRAQKEEPIVFVLHLASPGITYTDHGKTAMVILGDQITDIDGDYEDPDEN